MHYCINSLLKNNNEIMQYCIIINDIALIMHYRALLQMPDCDYGQTNLCIKVVVMQMMNAKEIYHVTLTMSVLHLLDLIPV